MRNDVAESRVSGQLIRCVVLVNCEGCTKTRCPDICNYLPPLPPPWYRIQLYWNIVKHRNTIGCAHQSLLSAFLNCVLLFFICFCWSKTRVDPKWVNKTMENLYGDRIRTWLNESRIHRPAGYAITGFRFWYMILTT